MSDTRLVRPPEARPATADEIDFAAIALELPDQSAYLGYYGLRTVPFRASADPKQLWLGPRQRRVLDTLATAVGQGSGIVLLTGEVGTGKTSLVNGLADRLSSSAIDIARLPGVGLDAADVAVAVAGALHVPGAVHTQSTLIERLARMSSDGSPPRTVLLIIDEAQSLGADVLREFGELATAATLSRCPLCILLVGQTELTWELADQRHAGLRQHVTTRCALDPLSASEVGLYIRHCLEQAGAKHEIFSTDAIDEIAALSHGAPAAINAICERALLTGHRRQLRVIGRSVIAETRVAPRSRSVTRPPMMKPVQRRGRAAPATTTVTGLPRRRHPRAMYAAVAVGIAAIAGAGYSLHAGWLVRGHDAVVPGSPEQPTTVADGHTSGKPAAPAPQVADATTRPEATPPTAPAAPITTPRSLAPDATAARNGPAVVAAVAHQRRDVLGRRTAAIREVSHRVVLPSGAGETRSLAPRIELEPQAQHLPATVTRRQESGGEPDASDPGGVIDWLIDQRGSEHH